MTAEFILRWCVVALAAANLAWTIPVALRSLRGPVPHWPNAGFAIPLSALLLGLVGMQFASLAQSSAIVPLLFYVAALALFKVIYWSRLVQIEQLTGKTTGSLRLWRLMKAKKWH